MTPKRRAVRAAVVLCMGAVTVAGAPAGAGAVSLTPGDVVVERDGNGTEALSASSASVWLSEFTPNGAPAAALALPTSASGANKPLVDGGSTSSDGGLTLSSNAECLLTVGYDTALNTEKVAETKASTVPRTVAVVNGKGEINTTTALSNFANENNARSAASDKCKTLWVGGNGTKTTGGVVEAALGASTGTQLTESNTNLRQVEIVNGQLYASQDPTKAPLGMTIGTVGSGLPVAKGQAVTPLPFEKAPEEPFAYSMLTLGLGTAPDTMYVADNARGAVVKYGLTGGKWVEHGSVLIPEVTGVTANDVNGAVTIYATSSAATSNGAAGKAGTLYRVSDVSSVNGTLSGVPVEIATAPANEAFRGVAFAPGTVIGSGGTPPSAPSISAAENTLAGALGDPTNRTMPITVEPSGYAFSELTVTVASSKDSVAPVSGITLTGTGRERTLSVTPTGVGISKLTITVEAPNGVFASTQISYGVSEYQGDASDRYYSGAADAGSSIDVGGGYMIVAGDGSNVLRLYHERTSGPPVRAFDFSGNLPFGTTEVNIHSMARAGNTLYVIGSFANTNSGEVKPARDTLFAANITGSGASTELTYLGSYGHLREDLVEWDEANGNPLGLAASAASGQAGERANGFKLQGLEFLAGSATEAYLSFRAPLEPTGEGPGRRNLALVVPLTNISSLPGGGPGTRATFGAPLEWNLGGLSIRQIRKNAEGEYLVIAGTPDSSDTTYQMYGWDGEAEDEPVALNKSIPPLVAEGVWDTITSTPEPIANGGGAEVLQDDSKTVWYGTGTKSAEKGLPAGLQKSLGRLITLQIPAPGTPASPHLFQSATPNQGRFTLRWKPASTLRARFTLQHQNAGGGWSTVASGLSKREYTFAAGNTEAEGTWSYRVNERNESGESGYSAESEQVKVDRTPPSTPTAAAGRSPDYSGAGGWYKDSVTVSFTAHGDPLLADGSLGSGVEPTSLTAPQTFAASGSHTASGSVSDKAGNISSQATLVVQVDATPPSVEVECPATVLVGTAGVTASVTASDAESGLASDPSGTVPIDTSQAVPVTITRTAVDNVGHSSTSSCTTQVRYPTPGAPALTAGVSPNANGLFTLGWSGADPMQYVGLGYTLQHHNAAGETWSTLAAAIGALSYEFSGAGEAEGTWVYRVQGSDPGRSEETEYSSVSAAVVVDTTPPNAPTPKASRPPDYAGSGGWYKDSVKVSFTANGDPQLTDGSPGSGVEPASLTAPETFNTSGSHTAGGTVADAVGNVSTPGQLSVQVDATPPSVEIQCPASALVGETGVTATVKASDAESGLASDPSGLVHIGTTHAGPVTVTRTAVDNVEHETTSSCTTQIHYPTPGAPTLSGGSSPNANGQFTLDWAGADPLQYAGLSYTLEHHSAATQTWSTVAGGIEALSYGFTGAGEPEGTWVYRVKASDTSHGEATEYSPASTPVVVDRTPPGAPTAQASRAPEYAGKGGWFKDSVQVSFSDNGDPALADGSPGSGVEPASLTAPETFNTSGPHTAGGTVADRVGNVSASGQLAVQVDATPPILEVQCPQAGVVGESGLTATVTASDAESGLASDPSGSVPINTTQAGPVRTTRTAVDNVGHETTRSCTTELHYSTPGAPALSGGNSPNDNGLFTLRWSGADPMASFGLGYTLQHHDASGETWSTVAAGIEALSYQFTGAGEAEGTWVYRVQGSDPSRGQTTPYSHASAPVVVDRTPPAAPTAKASRAADYAGNGGWYKDSVTVSFTAHGDPELADGSPGSGVEASSLTAPETFAASGTHPAAGTVADRAGNLSTPGALVVQVDATAPVLEIQCPATALVGEAGVTATVTASDAQSGLASDPSASVPISTAAAGKQTTTRTAVDNVGHETTRSCITQVRESAPEYGRCVAVPGETVGKKTVYHGLFTAPTCLLESATRSGKYEWTSGVLKPGFSSVTQGTSTVKFVTVNKAQVVCAHATSSGTMTSAKTVGSVFFKFTGCTMGEELKCTTPGHAPGEIETSRLEGVLGIERATFREGKETQRYVGLDLYPVGRAGAFLAYTCEGKPPTTLTGSVIGQMPTDQTFTKGTVKYVETVGRQQPEGFLGGAKDVLTNNSGQQVGISATIIQTDEEPLEVNAYF